MYSCDFWCNFIDLVEFFGCCCLTSVTSVTLFIVRSKGSIEKQQAVWPRLLESGLQPENPSNRRFFLSRGKLLSSLHRSKRLKAKYPHACCWKWTFPRAMSKIPSFSGHCDAATGQGALNFPRPRVVQSIHIQHHPIRTAVWNAPMWMGWCCM